MKQSLVISNFKRKRKGRNSIWAYTYWACVDNGSDAYPITTCQVNKWNDSSYKINMENRKEKEKGKEERAQ